MRHCYTSLLVGLLVVAWIQSGVMANNAKLPATCCFEFYESKIPHQRIRTYEKTASDCPMAGVVFTSVKNFQLCVKPSEIWVKKVIQRIDKRQLEAQL